MNITAAVMATFMATSPVVEGTNIADYLDPSRPDPFYYQVPPETSSRGETSGPILIDNIPELLEGYSGTGEVAPAHIQRSADPLLTESSGSFEPSAVIGEDSRESVPYTALPYASSVVQIEGYINGELKGSCSGFLYGYREVATAAHCVFVNLGDVNNPDRMYLDEWKIIPGRNEGNPGGEEPFGHCWSTAGFVTEEWLHEYDRKFDYAALSIEDCSWMDDVGQYAGYFGMLVHDDPLFRDFRVSGYPAVDEDKIYGTPWVATDAIVRRDTIPPENDVHDHIFVHHIDTTGGQSGSPIFYSAVDPGGRCGTQANCAIGVHIGDYREAPNAMLENAGAIISPRTILDFYTWGLESEQMRAT